LEAGKKERKKRREGKRKKERHGSDGRKTPLILK